MFVSPLDFPICFLFVSSLALAGSNTLPLTHLLGRTKVTLDPRNAESCLPRTPSLFQINHLHQTLAVGTDVELGLCLMPPLLTAQKMVPCNVCRARFPWR